MIPFLYLCTFVALGPESKVTPALPAEIKPTIPKDIDQEPKCECDENYGESGTKLSEGEAELVIAFENELHNTIYVK